MTPEDHGQATGGDTFVALYRSYRGACSPPKAAFLAFEEWAYSIERRWSR